MKCVMWRHVDLSLRVWYMYEVCGVATCQPLSGMWYMYEVCGVATCRPVSRGLVYV